ncbi:MAG: cytochrome D ubiquinol oxidase subunit I [Candidatus Eisenbacteria bacterium]|nr:cytochrome D ubiquinol oxidase subunit I [Candidatus Eisenbacteria bacterium]
MKDAPEKTPAERSLDPADWDTFRDLSHRMLDVALDYIRDVRERPVWSPLPADLERSLAEPLPVEPQGAERACDDLRRLILPHSTGNIHPRFFGWVHGSGTPGGILAEIFAAAMNSNVGGRNHGAVYVERQVLRWAAELFGFPPGCGGIVTSGTSMGNLIGMAVARNDKAAGDVRAGGLRAGGERLTAYASEEAHVSVAKAMEILGLGGENLRRVPVRDDFTMDTEALDKAIVRDAAEGRLPFCVVASAGTVNTGAMDDLGAIARICADHGLWMHVDGAFGGLAVLSDRLRDRLRGVEKADSIAFDFHKWMHVQYDAGCVLVNRNDLHLQTFSSRPDYLLPADSGLAGGNPWFCEYGPELSRGFRALKVWFLMKEHGLRRIAEKIEDNCRQAARLAKRVLAEPALELLAPASLNIVCFRYQPPGADEKRLDELNGRIVVLLQERGIAAPSTTLLRNRLAIRVCLTNHRTVDADLDMLVDSILRIGAELTAAE